VAWRFFFAWRQRRPYKFEADVVAQWAVAGWNGGRSPLLSEVGPAAVTLAAHEGIRVFALPKLPWHGVHFMRQTSTWTVTALFFFFTLTVTWCHSPNFEKLEPWEMAK
jgi:hypothetical protein